MSDTSPPPPTSYPLSPTQHLQGWFVSDGVGVASFGLDGPLHGLRFGALAHSGVTAIGGVFTGEVGWFVEPRTDFTFVVEVAQGNARLPIGGWKGASAGETYTHGAQGVAMSYRMPLGTTALRLQLLGGFGFDSVGNKQADVGALGPWLEPRVAWEFWLSPQFPASFFVEGEPLGSTHIAVGLTIGVASRKQFGAR